MPEANSHDPCRQDVLLARIDAYARPLAGLLERLVAEPGVHGPALEAARCALQRALLLAAAAVSLPKPEPPIPALPPQAPLVDLAAAVCPGKWLCWRRRGADPSEDI